MASKLFTVSIHHLADDENGEFFPTTARVILYFYVRNLNLCAYSRFEFLASDWHCR